MRTHEYRSPNLPFGTKLTMAMASISVLILLDPDAVAGVSMTGGASTFNVVFGSNEH